MRLKKHSTKQKLRGAYYTPHALADAMTNFFISEKISCILEPSFGDGVFLDSIIKNKLINKIDNVTAVEIEKSEVEKSKRRYVSNKNMEILNEDFFDFYKRCNKKKQYDLILGNPPYIRYQYLTENQRKIQSQILLASGMKSNKLINAWVCFLVACVQMLSDNGKIAFVVPAEILQVAYAEDLRLFLSNELSRITLITFKKLIFQDIEQEVLVFVGEKGGEEKGIRIIDVDDLDELKTLDFKKNNFQKLQHVKEKWTKYFLSTDDINAIQSIRQDSRFTKFSDLAIINIGITTGNNNYFSINKQTEELYNLKSVTLPLIGKSSHTHGIYFYNSDWQCNIENNKKAMLVAFPETSFKNYPKLHKKYIKFGLQSNQHIGYKCSIRDRWYIMPSIWVPDAFFLRRSNKYPKFMLNRCSAVSTDTMHRIKFNKDVIHENILLSYYNSISFAFTEICGRSYGGGVLEVLPGEMGNIILPEIKKIDLKLRNELLKRIDIMIRKKDDIELILDMVDKELLVKFIGIEPSLCKKFRQIWKKLQSRRLARA